MKLDRDMHLHAAVVLADMVHLPPMWRNRRPGCHRVLRPALLRSYSNRMTKVLSLCCRFMLPGEIVASPEIFSEESQTMQPGGVLRTWD